MKHVRVASGVRFDLALKDATALAAYTGEFTGGQLKIAPEHCVPDVLDLMRKPGMKPFEAFLEAFVRYSEAHGKEQYVIPYLMSAFPGCTDAHMRQLGDWLAARNWSPRQVQCLEDHGAAQEDTLHALHAAHLPRFVLHPHAGHGGDGHVLRPLYPGRCAHLCGPDR